MKKLLLLIPCLAISLLHADSSNEDALRAEKMQARMEAQAMYTLARTMLEEKHITDVSGVPFLLEEAAKQGSIRAELLLLDIWEGKYKGLPKNEANAFNLAKLLSERPILSEEIIRQESRRDAQAEAQFRLALYHEKGIACRANPNKAFHWMQSAMRLGHPAAQVELARYYMQGVGCELNYITALQLLKDQTRLDSSAPNLYFYLGYMCERGLGLSRPQLSWARQFYQRGAELGDARATNNLASLYERGAGVGVDYSIALRLYRDAANLNNKDASVNMQRLVVKIEQEDSKSMTEPWYLRVNRGYLRIMKSLPVTLPFAEEFKAWNQRLEEEYAEMKHQREL
ncbi:MAG: tetratricopeptide repeat protein [Akkermansia sp.]